MLTRLAGSLVGRSDAADVLSAATLKTLSRLERAKVEDVEAYLFVACVNEAKRWIRRERRRARLESNAGDPVVQSRTPEPHDPSLVAAVQELSLKQKACIVLVYWEDLSIGEVASKLQVSPGSVKQHLHRAYRKLRRSVQHEQ